MKKKILAVGVLGLFFVGCNPVQEVLNVAASPVLATLDVVRDTVGGRSSLRYEKPSLQTTQKMQKLHKGYKVQAITGTTNCRAVFPRALIDMMVRTNGETVTDEQIKSVKLKWTGQCSNGLMHGKGTLELTSKKAHQLYYDGYMYYGFFRGNVKGEGSSSKRGKSFRRITTKKVYIDLNTHDDYMRYEEARGYDGLYK